MIFFFWKCDECLQVEAAAVAAIFHHHQETSSHKAEAVAADLDSHHQVNTVHHHKAAVLGAVSVKVKELAPVAPADIQAVDQVAKVSNFG